MGLDQQAQLRHMLLAWASLISVALCDFYVYLLASGTFTDPRIF